MNIDILLDEYTEATCSRKNPIFRPEVVRQLLSGNKEYSFKKQYGWQDSENLGETIKGSVSRYQHDKQKAIDIYRDFLRFLERKRVPIPEVDFPPINISSQLERLVFMLKYFQGGNTGFQT